MASKLNYKREKLKALLPSCNWQIATAAKKAGYSKHYAETSLCIALKKDISFTKWLSEQIAQSTESEANRIEKLKQFWLETMNDTKLSRSVRLKASELMGKAFGVFAERRIIEDVARQRELDEAQRKEAERIADVLAREAQERTGGPQTRKVYVDGPKIAQWPDKASEAV